MAQNLTDDVLIQVLPLTFFYPTCLIFSEYEALSHTLDMLDGCLDQLEHRNDSLFAKLEDLLQTSKETREELASAAESISDDISQEEKMDAGDSKPDGNEGKTQDGPQGTDIVEGENSGSQDKTIS
jgi:hypothetical protein